MEKLEEIEVVRAATEWLQSAKTLDVIRSQPARQYKNLPSLSVQKEVAVAIKCVTEPRETSKRGRDYAFSDVVLVEPAVLYTKEKGQFEAAAGSEASINWKRHASLWRNIQEFFPLKDKELVVANLGKRTFETPKAPSGKATGYEYRIMLLADLKKKLGKK